MKNLQMADRNYAVTPLPFAYISTETSWGFLSDILVPSFNYKPMTTLGNSMDGTTSVHLALSDYVLVR